MASKDKKTTKKRVPTATVTKVTRIKAIDADPVKNHEELVADMTETKQKGLMGTLKAIGGYFVGAWVELRQVRWPSRKATWGLTLAVILFTAFFVGMIILLDMLFQQLFDLILG